ncbi:MAG TPA: hypothetical protein PKZ12_01100 [Smithellaceae bacterium]|nr:hypothetical protein [Smithellaceae bacterium]
MGLLKGNISFVRFHVDGRLPAGFLNFVNNRIKGNSFREIKTAAQDKCAGWVSLTDVLDSNFTEANYALGDYLIFSLRIDRKKIPPALIKIKVMEEEKRYLAESGKDRINKAVAAGIRDKVQAGLLAKSEPVPSFYDVCWQVSQNTVYFSCLADKVADDFAQLFKETFSLSLQRILPWETPGAKGKQAPPAESSLGLPGRDFLSWLWYKTEERGGRIELTGGTEVEIQFQKKIVLGAGEGEYSQSVACHGLHADSNEGKEALRQGKKVKEAGIKLISDKNEWEFIFKGDTFYFQSLKLPLTGPEENGADAAGKILERIYLIENAVKTMDALYDKFLALRLAPQWEQREALLIAKWLGK